MTPDEVRAEVERLYTEHRQAGFPAEALSIQIAAGGDIALLDARIAGCIDTWIARHGSLDQPRHEVLREGIAEVDRVIGSLPDGGTARRYFERLRRLATLAVLGS